MSPPSYMYMLFVRHTWNVFGAFCPYLFFFLCHLCHDACPEFCPCLSFDPYPYLSLYRLYVGFLGPSPDSIDLSLCPDCCPFLLVPYRCPCYSPPAQNLAYVVSVWNLEVSMEKSAPNRPRWLPHLWHKSTSCKNKLKANIPGSLTVAWYVAEGICGISFSHLEKEFELWRACDRT